jgi:hypothetical protein
MQGHNRNPDLASLKHGQGGFLALASSEVDPDEPFEWLVGHWP